MDFLLQNQHNRKSKMETNLNPYSYKLQGKGLKFNNEEDIQPYLAEIQKMERLEEIHVGGHTLGVGACKALAELLSQRKELKVSSPFQVSFRRP